MYGWDGKEKKGTERKWRNGRALNGKGGNGKGKVRKEEDVFPGKWCFVDGFESNDMV